MNASTLKLARFELLQGEGVANSNSLPYRRKIEEEPLEDGRIQYGRGAGMRKLVFMASDEGRQEVKKTATVDDHRRKLILIWGRMGR